MAVTVIDEKPDPSVVKKATCRSCGVTVQYLPCDVKRYSGRDYSGGPDGRDWVDCPSCQREIILRAW